MAGQASFFFFINRPQFARNSRKPRRGNCGFLVFFMADIDAIIVFGGVFVLALLAVLAFLAKKTSDNVEKRLFDVNGRLMRLSGLIDRIDGERRAAVAASEKKVGRVALEKIFSEAIDFISEMRRKENAA